MKKILILCTAAFTAMLFAACGGESEKKTDASVSRPERTEPKIVAMPTIDFSDSVKVGSHSIVYSLHREADDSLAIVKDEEGYEFYDNYYLLNIKKDGAQFFRRRFTKASFNAYIDEGFRKYGVLDGFRFLEVKDGNICFSASVSYPESDMVTPLMLSIAPDGSYSVEQMHILDVEEEMSDTIYLKSKE